MESSKKAQFWTGLLVTMAITVVVTITMMRMPSAGSLVATETARIEDAAVKDPEGREASYRKCTDFSACKSLQGTYDKWRKKKEERNK